MRINNLKKILVNPKASLSEGIAVIDNGQLKIALVLDENKKLLGLLSDGDVRRGLLNDISLSDCVSKVMNKNFISVNEEIDDEVILSLMRKNSILQVPILDKDNFIKELFVHESLLNQDTKLIPNPVVIMAGGQGKRLRPLTQNCPKPMIKVNGKPILEILLRKLSDIGFRNFYLSINYLKEQIIDYFGDGSSMGININYLIEKKSLGTAGSLTLLPENINSQLIVMNADVLTNFNAIHLLNFHTRYKADATLSVHRSDFEVPYGVVKAKGIDLVEFQEKPVYKHIINAGIYVINPKIIKLLKNNQKADMPDLIMKASKNNCKVIICPIHEYWIDIGMIDKLNKAEEDLSDRIL